MSHESDFSGVDRSSLGGGSRGKAREAMRRTNQNMLLGKGGQIVSRDDNVDPAISADKRDVRDGRSSIEARLARRANEDVLDDDEKSLAKSILAGYDSKTFANTMSLGINRSVPSTGIPAVDSAVGLLSGGLVDKALETMQPSETNMDGYDLGVNAATHNATDNLAGTIGSMTPAGPIGGNLAATASNIARNAPMRELQSAFGRTGATDVAKDNSQGQSARSRAIAALKSPSAPQSAKSASQFYATRPSLSGYNKDVSLALRS